MEASGSDRDNKQQEQGAVKRKMDSDDGNAEKQVKNAQTGTDDKPKIYGGCLKCREWSLDEQMLHKHSVQHQQEEQLEKLQTQRQRQIDDDFVLYVRANRLHEYRPQPSDEPDFDYIVHNYRFDREEWLAFAQNLKRPFLKILFGLFKASANYDQLKEQEKLIEKMNINTELISYLLENGALSVQDAINFFDILMTKVDYNDYASMIVSYLLKKDFKIKAEWVAKVINDDKLIERIKERHTFTFDEIHKARQWDLFSEFDVKALKTFYTQLQKHFFNPNFESAFDDVLDEDFKCSRTDSG